MVRRAATYPAFISALVLVAAAAATPAAAAAVAAPKVTAVSPRSGPTAGGTRVTITGTGFSGLTRSRVTFGTTAASKITVVSSTKVTATAPKGAAGRANVHIVTTHGTSASNAADGFTYVAKPTVTSVETQYSGSNVSWGPDTGGSALTVTGTNFRTGMTVMFAGRTISNVTYETATKIGFTSPTHAPGAVNISVTSPGGTATKNSAFTYRRWWQAPTTIDASQGDPALLSCPDQQCYAIDPFNNFLTRATPTATWTNQGATISPGVAVEDLSCPVDNFCAAVDKHGHALTYNGTKWQASAIMTQYFGGPLVTVACTSTTFCIAQDTFSDYTIWNGSSWGALRLPSGAQITAKTPSPSSAGAAELSCAGPSNGSSAQCEAVDGDNHVRGFTYSTSAPHNAWSLVQTTDADGTPTALSCHDYASTFACVLTDTSADFDGRAFVYSGGSWGAAQLLASGATVPAVSCVPSVITCVAVDAVDHAYTLDTNGWHQSVAQGSDFLAISCNTSYCATSNQDGTSSTLELSDSTWQTPTPLVTVHKGITILSCADATHCFASDGGSAVIRDGGAWGSVTDLGLAGDQLTSASCPTTSFCMAITTQGRFFTDTSGTLSTATSSAKGFLLGVSCASADLCYAVSNDTAYRWTSGEGWDTTPISVPIASGDSISALSCVPNQNQCMIATYTGDAFDLTGDPATATSLAPTGAAANSDQVQAISCPTSTFCVAVGSAGFAYRWNGSTWTTMNLTDGGTLDKVDCGSSSACLAVGDFGNAYSWTGSVWQPTQSANLANTQAVASFSDGTGLAGNLSGEVVPFQ